MASLLRFRGIQQTLSRLVQRRSVGTSNAKKSDTISTTPTTTSSSSTTTATVAECKPPKKNWVSYGFSEVSEDIDRHLTHLSFFVSVSIVLTLGSYVFCYLPDFRMRDWYHREGYLELRRREKLGLPRVDINLIDPAKVKLPTDEELKGVEIII